MSRTGDSDAVTVAPEPDDQLEASDPFDADDVRVLQRKSIGVLGGSQVLGGVAVAGSLPAGALIAESISGSEAAAGLAQTFGVVGAALLALPLARVVRRGRARP